jgi:hypothetical protein
VDLPALSAQRTESLTVMPVVVAAGDTAVRIEAPVTGTWPSARARPVPAALEAARHAAAGPPVQAGQSSSTR